MIKIALLIGISLLLPGCPPLRAQSGSDDLHVRKYTYATLSPYEKQLFDTFLADELPAGKRVADVLTNTTSLRGKTRLAEALLFRNQPGDKEKAAEVLTWILQNQYRDENTTVYGIWKTSLADDKFDQNWREFIGCDLIIIRQQYSQLLPPEIQKEIETGLIHAAKGAMKRDVTPHYSNIALMSAFLMNYVGTAFKLDALQKAGLQKARAIFRLYQSHQTFSEYNSPTYYGVTLIGMALWRELAADPELKAMGQTLERSFWHEVATVYNPNLRNMPGPYFRGYGMDMQRYVSIMGMWIALAVDTETLAPIPSGIGPKYGEMGNLAPIFNLGLSIPKADLAALRRFSGPHFISRTVPNTYKGDSLKRVTIMVGNDWMMGGLWGNRRAWGQVKTGTLHWKMPDGEVGWLLVPGDGNTNVRVDKTRMQVYLANPDAKTLMCYIYAKNTPTTAFSATGWALPGMLLGVQTTLKQVAAESVDPAVFQKEWDVSERYPALVKIVYEIPAGWDTTKALLELIPTR